jgi:hypothetical protein
MTTLTTQQIGSVVFNLIQNIPIGISGLLVNGFLPEQSVYMAENYTGDSISLSAIEDRYQPAIINLTISQVLSQMEAQGMGTKSVSIGELSITKGMKEGTSSDYKQLGLQLLSDLGYKFTSYQTFT